MSLDVPCMLLVEDSDDDAFLFSHAAKRAAFGPRLLVVSDGEEALNYVRGAGRFSDRLAYPVPDLVLLDMKLPRLNGLEVLRAIRSSESAFKLPVIILTSSRHESDVEMAGQLGANAYVCKPTVLEEQVELVQAIEAFWFGFQECTGGRRKLRRRP